MSDNNSVDLTLRFRTEADAAPVEAQAKAVDKVGDAAKKTEGAFAGLVNRLKGFFSGAFKSDAEEGAKAIEKVGDAGKKGAGGLAALSKEGRGATGEVREGTHVMHLFEMATGQAQFSVRGLMGGLKALFSLLVANPFGIILAVLGAIVVAFVEFEKKSAEAAKKQAENHKVMDAAARESTDVNRQLDKSQVNFDKEIDSSNKAADAFDHQRDAAEKLKAQHDKFEDAQTRSALADINVQKLQSAQAIKTQGLDPEAEKRALQQNDDDYGAKELQIRNRVAQQKAEREVRDAAAKLQQADTQANQLRGNQVTVGNVYRQNVAGIDTAKGQIETALGNRGAKRNENEVKGEEYAESEALAGQTISDEKAKPDEIREANNILSLVKQYKELVKRRKAADDQYKKQQADAALKLGAVAAQFPELMEAVSASRENYAAASTETTGATVAQQATVSDHARQVSREDALKQNAQDALSLDTKKTNLTSEKDGTQDGSRRSNEIASEIADVDKEILDNELQRKELEGKVTDIDRASYDAKRAAVDAQLQATQNKQTDKERKTTVDNAVDEIGGYASKDAAGHVDAQAQRALDAAKSFKQTGSNEDYKKFAAAFDSIATTLENHAAAINDTAGKSDLDDINKRLKKLESQSTTYQS